MSTRQTEHGIYEHLLPKRIRGESVAMYELRTRTGRYALPTWPANASTATLEKRRLILEELLMSGRTLTVQEVRSRALIEAELRRRRDAAST